MVSQVKSRLEETLEKINLCLLLDQPALIISLEKSMFSSNRKVVLYFLGFSTSFEAMIDAFKKIGASRVGLVNCNTTRLLRAPLVGRLFQTMSQRNCFSLEGKAKSQMIRKTGLEGRGEKFVKEAKKESYKSCMLKNSSFAKEYTIRSPPNLGEVIEEVKREID